MIALGIDPGLAHLGIALLDTARSFCPEHDGPGCICTFSCPQRREAGIVAVAVFETKPETKKRRLNSGDDWLRRSLEMRSAIERFLLDTMKVNQFEDIGITAIEALTLPRSSSSAAKLASAFGLAVGLARGRVQVVHRAVVRAMVAPGKSKITKDDAIAWCERYWPDCFEQAGVKQGHREHAADALLTGLVALVGGGTNAVLGKPSHLAPTALNRYGNPEAGR